MLIATDLDGTLAHGSRDDISHIFSLIQENKYSVAYVTGRDIKNFKKLIKTIYKDKQLKLLLPDYLIALNGAKVYQCKKLPIRQLWIDKKWAKAIKPGWNKKACFKAFKETAKKIRFGNDQPAVVNVRYKPAPFYLELIVHHQKLNEIKQTLSEECIKRGTKVNIIYDYLEKNYVDIGLSILDKIDKEKANLIRLMRDEKDGLYVLMPSATNKGEAVDYIRKKLQYEKSDVIVAGDSGNDFHLINYGFKSIVVKNAHPIILKEPLIKEHSNNANIYFAKEEGAKGLLEGIETFKPNLLSLL